MHRSSYKIALSSLLLVSSGLMLTGGPVRAETLSNQAFAKVQAKALHVNGPAGGFVYAQGDHFMLNGKPFYFAGTNCYYLNYDSPKMVDDVLVKAHKMGLKVVRMWGFMDGTVSNGVSLQPSLGVFSQDGLQHIDYADAEAKKLGLKLVITLVNNWNDFGGMNQYVQWIEGSSGTHDDFYTNPKIVSAYENAVKHIIDRKNAITGIPYKDDPTVMTWELANEPRDESDPSGATLTHWANTVSTYIHHLDPNHMIALGDEGWFGDGSTSAGYAYPYSNSEGLNWRAILKLPYISYGTYHLYPESWGQNEAFGNQWIKDHITAARKLHKPAVLEEFGDTDQAGRDGIYQSWTNTVVANRGAGDQAWMLSGIQDDGTLYPNYDGYAIYDPSTTANVLSYHAAVMNRLSNRQPLLKTKPRAFALTGPAGGSKNVSLLPTFTWTPSLAATGYTFTVSTSPSLRHPIVLMKNVQRTDATLSTALKADTTYYWSVTANNAYGFSKPARMGSFHTMTLPTQPMVIDDFGGYKTTAAVQAAYPPNPNGDPISVALSSTTTHLSAYALQVNYTLSKNGYAGVNHALPDANWSSYAGIQFWLKPDVSGNSVSIQFQQADGSAWQASYTPLSAGWQLAQIPFSAFQWQTWSTKATMNEADVKQVSIYFGGSSTAKGTMYFDDLSVYP